ncbi:hypothetical protein D9M71_693130 [compost metagenome]
MRRGLAGDEYAAHVHRQHVVEVGQVEFGHRRHCQHASIVDQDIQPAEGFHGVIHGQLHGRRVGAVGPQGQGLAAVFGNLPGQFFCRAGGADIGEGHLRAFAGQAPHDGCTNASGTALNQGHFAFEGVLLGHADLLLEARPKCLGWAQYRRSITC